MNTAITSPAVIRSGARKRSRKTILTREQVRTLSLYPHAESVSRRGRPRLHRGRYESHLPVAPGVVLIKAAGQQPGHQMVYCASSRGEHLFIGDVAWTLANVTQFSCASRHHAAHQRGCAGDSCISCDGQGHDGAGKAPRDPAMTTSC